MQALDDDNFYFCPGAAIKKSNERRENQQRTKALVLVLLPNHHDVPDDTVRMIRGAFVACILVVNFHQGMLGDAFIPTAVLGVSHSHRVGAKVRPDIDGLVESMGLTPVKRSTSTPDMKLTSKIMGGKKLKTRKEENSFLANKNDPTIISREGEQKGSTASGVIQPLKNNEDPTTPTQKQSPSTLHETRDVSLQTQLDYSREGHTSIRNFIPADIIQQVHRDLKAYSKDEKIAQQKGEDSLPFLQFFNTVSFPLHQLDSL
jgi:hypothetical protein